MPSASAVLMAATAAFAEPGDGAEPVGAGREDAGGRAEGVEQETGEVLGYGGGVRSGQQELQNLAVVDGVATGAEKACPQFVALAGIGGVRPGRGLEEGHVANGGSRCIGEGHATGSRTGRLRRSAARARQTSMRCWYSERSRSALASVRKASWVAIRWIAGSVR